MKFKGQLVFLIECLQGGGASRVTSFLAENLGANLIATKIITLDAKVDRSTTSSIICIADSRKKFFGRWTLVVQIRCVLRSIIKAAPGEPLLVVGVLPHMSFYGRMASLGLSCKFVSQEHLYPDKEFASKKWLSKFLRNCAYVLSDRILLLTPSCRKPLPAILQKKLIVIPNPAIPPMSIGSAIDVEPFRPYVISIGRLENQKRFDRMIEVFSRTQRQFPDWHLLILGDGSKRRDLEVQIEDLKLSHCIHLLGHQSNVKQFMENASIFAMMSEVEGMPLVLMEAMQLGVPALYADSESGPRDLIEDGVSGMICSRTNDEEARDKLIQLMADESLRKSLGLKAAKRIEDFNFQNIQKIWEGFLESLGVERNSYQK